MERERGETGSRRWRRWLVVALCSAALLAVALRIVLPPALEWGIAYAIHRQAGLPARVENVDLWLIRGAIAIEGPSVGGKPGEIPDAGLDATTSLLGWQRLYADLEWADLIDGRVHVRELVLEGARVRLEAAPGGGIDLAFLEGLPESEPEVGPAEAPSEPWPVQLDTLVLRDVRVNVLDSSQHTEPVEFALAELSLGDLVLEDGVLSLGEFGIREPILRVEQKFALSLAGTGDTAPEEQAPTPSEPDAAHPSTEPVDGLRYRIEHLALEGAGFTLLVDGSSLDLAYAFSADDITLRGGVFPIALHLEVEDGSIDLEGKLRLIPLVYEGRLRWQDLPVPPALLASNPGVVPWIRSYRSHGELELAFSAEPGPGAEPAALRASGRASVVDLELANPGDAEEAALAWTELAIGLREAFVPLPVEGVEPARIRVALESVRLVDPRILYTNPPESLDALLERNVAAGDGIATESDAVESGPAEIAAPIPLELSIDLVEVIDGDVQYVDHAVDYRGKVRDLDVRLEGVRWPGPGLASARITARPPKGKALSLSGSLDGRSGALELDLEKLALPPLGAYAEPAGYRLGSGSLSLRTKLRADGATLDAHNRIELHQLEVDALDPGDFQERFGMPLDLALALLRDSSGKISLSVPVTVEEAGAGIRLRSIIQSALRQALVGAASSPLKMAGLAVSTLGVGGGTSEPLASVPGRAALADGQEERLAGTAALLSARPGLGLELRGRAGPEDVPRLAEEILIERVGSGGDLPELEDAGFLARRRVVNALRERGRGEPGGLEEEDQALLARYVAAVDVPSQKLAELARLRAEAARDALMTEAGVEATRLDLDEAIESGEPGVLLELRSIEDFEEAGPAAARASEARGS
jgi:hypothetical protein